MSNKNISNIIDGLCESKKDTFDVVRIVDVGDSSSDKMPLGTVSGSLNDMKREATKKYGKIKDIDIKKKEIIVEVADLIEGLSKKTDIVKVLNSLKFGEEVNDLRVGEWTIDIWSDNMSYGKVYIIQVESGKKEFNIPDIQNEAEWNRAINNIIKKIK